ncbi:MAG: histidine phosphatase family protein [Clostridia bacterium]|nr:histidine phosphatase family protein [Clostridia bacterium]
MKVYVVRHGQTDWNLEGKLQGSTDVILNDNGRNQVSCLSERLKDIDFGIIISSPLKRAMETAQIINKEKKLEIVVFDDLKERSFGSFEGKVYPDISAFWDYERDYNENGVESVKTMLNRVFNAMDSIISEYKDKDVLIVAHACVMIGIDCYFNGFKENHDFSNYCFENGNYYEYNVK